MNKILSLISILSFMSIYVHGQCGDGTLTILRTQSEVNTFAPGCTEYNGSLVIDDDNNGIDNITNLDSFMSITRTSGVFQIRNNPYLESLSGLNSIEHTGSLRIINNPLLNTLEGLNSLYSLTGDISILDNDNLSNLNGLESLTNMVSSSGVVEIRNNSILSDITGLANFSTYISLLIITNNNNLESLNGLQNIMISVNSDSPLSDDLEIYNNEKLSHCNILSVCEALSDPDVTFSIYNNDVTCNTKEEIEISCTTSTSSSDSQNVLIFPNPFDDFINIKSTKSTQISVYDAIGQLRLKRDIFHGDNQLDFNCLDKGLYTVRIHDGKSMKIIKL